MLASEAVETRRAALAGKRRQQEAVPGRQFRLLERGPNRKGYSDHRWATYKQIKDMGGQVRKGEKATHVLFYKFDDERPGARAGDGSPSPSASAVRCPGAPRAVTRPATRRRLGAVNGQGVASRRHRRRWRRPTPLAPLIWSSRSQTTRGIRRSVECGDRKKRLRGKFSRNSLSLYI